MQRIRNNEAFVPTKMERYLCDEPAAKQTMNDPKNGPKMDLLESSDGLVSLFEQAARKQVLVLSA